MCENVTSVLVILVRPDLFGCPRLQTDYACRLISSQPQPQPSRMSCFAPPRTPSPSTTFHKYSIRRIERSLLKLLCPYNYECPIRWYIADGHDDCDCDCDCDRELLSSSSTNANTNTSGGLCQQERHTAHWLPLAAGQESSTDADDGKPKVAVIWQLLGAGLVCE